MLWNYSRFGDHMAVVDECGQRLTYAQLAQEGRALSAAAGGRCLVMQLCQNTLGSLVGYAGFLEEGAALALIGADMSREAFDVLYRAYTPKYLWAPTAFKHPGCLPVYKRFGYHLLRTAFAETPPLHPELALLLTTSGSTGSPKFVRQSYGNIRANTDSIVEYLALTGVERPITTLPMHYTYGLSIVNTHLDVGATLLLTDKGIAQKDFWRFFREEGASSFGGVPYTYEMLDRMRFTQMELPSLTTLTQAGGKLLPALHRKLAEWCMRTGRKFIVMYGQCEATARMAYLPWEQSLAKAGAMGVAIPGGRFELVDESGAIITNPYTAGELRYYGNNVTLGYAESAADLCLGDERNGVLDTGDIAQMDEDGCFTIVGRKKRFLKLFGNRVNLDEAEEMVRMAFPGSDVACGGVDDQLCLFAVQENELPAMRAFLIEKTGLNPAAFRIQAVRQIPKNEAGKTLYKELEP